MISIVDDDQSVRSALGSLVRSLGLRACTFGSAEEFLQSKHVDDTSCLITDLQMPGLNGVDLQSLLLARGYDTPIIIVTAFPEEHTKLRAMDAGALGFLCKPFESRTLVKLINTALATGRNT
jgi:FixJ family two-component response regulator